MYTIRTRVLIISDTHCATLTAEGHAERLPLPKADLLIHCGDLTMTGRMDEYHQTLDMLNQIDAPVKLVIAGNHDLSLDREFVMSHRDHDPQRRQPSSMSEQQAHQRWSDARALWTDSRAKAEGVTFLDEGEHTIELSNGASVNIYASPYTPHFCDWAFAYEHDQDRYNPTTESLRDAHNIAMSPLPSRGASEDAIDIVITHGPAWLRLDLTTQGVPVGCPHLLQALSRARPLIHCFGHIHEGWGAERVSWSTSTNDDAASISISDFQTHGWEGKIRSHQRMSDQHAVHSPLHAVHLDLSSDSTHPLQAGQETVFINAAIMDVNYKPANTPWLVDIDLRQRRSG